MPSTTLVSTSRVALDPSTCSSTESPPEERERVVVDREREVLEVRFMSRSYSACAAFCSLVALLLDRGLLLGELGVRLRLGRGILRGLAAAAAAFIFAVSSSCADSRSIAVPYFACRGEAATAASIAASGDGDMRACGARRRVQATGSARPSRS